MAADFQIFTSLRYDPVLLEAPAAGMEHAGWNYTHASPVYMLDFHRDRMLRAATHWNWDAAVEVLSGDLGLERLNKLIIQAVGQDQRSPMRVKVTVSKDGSLGCEMSETPKLQLSNLFPTRLPAPRENSAIAGRHLPPRSPEYEVFVDDVKTSASEYTHFKTTKRVMYDAARQRARILPTDKKEVLIINHADGSIMEGSLTTPYFWRGGRWVTPPVSSTYSPEAGSGGQDGTTRRWMLERYFSACYS
ncbi:aminodeoxychorismate lyase [Diplogelasinospora grovesii]|uniref:Aminodeoxychorismate lyase n=1 Tax=Diplogelasinospora grovesii TaxID=303347 RepID=A0AAN6NAT0_9PEZI|nr:aminodeoxychorismate lyase [Diplogelasinospora grovesii]